jgi:Core-2/I-Branching enzyme
MAEPRIGFVMLVHKAPEQVRRLALRLQPHRVFVHVDARAPSALWDQIREMEAEGLLQTLQRFRSGWASWGLVEATLVGLQESIKAGCSHTVIFSGQDYPLRPVREIAEYFTTVAGRSWLYQAPVPITNGRIGDVDGGVGRFAKWHLTIHGRHLRIPVRRSLPQGLMAHYGQMQCCVSAELGRYMLEEVGRRPELRKFFRRTQAPDELLIPTLAMSSSFAPGVIGDNLWYTDWFEGSGAHPKVLRMEDFDRLAASAHSPSDMGGPSPVKLFARKFELGQSGDVLDRIDRELLGVSVP